MCCVLSHVILVQPFATPWTVARQAPLSMGILQARILEWVSMSSSRGSSQLRDQTQVSQIMGGFFTIWATKEHGHFYGAIWNHTYIMPMGRLSALKSIRILLEISDKRRHHKLVTSLQRGPNCSSSKFYSLKDWKWLFWLEHSKSEGAITDKVFLVYKT